ncbi:MAG: lytic murein transglycosylase [Hyphomicrobiales bacterium]
MTIAGQANARTCGNTGAGFNKWLAQFKKDMRAEGFSRRTLSSSLNGVTYSKKVIRLDRSQKTFKQSFEKFYKRRTQGMQRIGRKKMKKHARTFARVEKTYGVPKEILTAIWGLETAFGHFMGNKPIFRSLATLAYDCRRTEFFTNELISALKIVEKGDLRAEQMVGAWAGEIGQTQFLASRYVDYAVSFDGNRKRDLYGSVPDVLASTAAWFQGNGWRRGERWRPGSHNYEVLKKWNRATVYQKTIAKLADALAGR